MRFLARSLMLLCVPVLGCSSTAATTTITRPELVQVLPQDFIGAERCGDGPGLVGSYVATLFDVTTDSSGNPLPETGFPLPSSPPTSCQFPVTFAFVLNDHRYRAEIDAYNRLPQSAANDSNAKHIKAVSLGGRAQEDGTGERVSPTWKATCGGYPPSDRDAGLGPDASGVPDPVVSDGGDAGPPGVVSYNSLTTTVHDCSAGLMLVQ